MISLLKSLNQDSAEHKKIFGDTLLVALVKGTPLPPATRTTATALIKVSAGNMDGGTDGSEVRPGPSTMVTSAKRKHAEVEEQDVIDLCSD